MSIGNVGEGSDLPKIERDPFTRDEEDIVGIIIHALEKRILKITEEESIKFSPDECALNVVKSRNPKNRGGKRVDLHYPVYSHDKKDLTKDITGYAFTSFELVSQAPLIESNLQAANRKSKEVNKVQAQKFPGGKKKGQFIRIGPEAQLSLGQVKFLQGRIGQGLLASDKFPDKPIDEPQAA